MNSSAARSLHVVPPLGAEITTNDSSSKRLRIIDAALECIAVEGIKGTTVEDISTRAGMSRATLYRIFPGGRDAVLGAVVETEIARFFSGIAVAMGSATSLEGVLVAGIFDAATRLSGSPALSTILRLEPWLLMRHVSFGEMDRLLSVASDFAEPFFARWLEPDEARRAAEFAVRTLLSYVIEADVDLDLTEKKSVERLVACYVLPGVEALQRAE
ncbi:MAG: TetR/AcrR family transcriptional regulator [Actinomycetes bacterium]|jgi:hypothetical protein